MKILIVEDDPDCRDLLRTVLEVDGHTVFEAATGGDALELAAKCSPELVFMDLSLAESQFDGTETMKRLRGLGSFSHVPIVAVTAHAMADHRREAMAAGFDDYVTKPFNIDGILALVANMRGRERTS